MSHTALLIFASSLLAMLLKKTCHGWLKIIDDNQWLGKKFYCPIKNVIFVQIRMTSVDFIYYSWKRLHTKDKKPRVMIIVKFNATLDYIAVVWAFSQSTSFQKLRKKFSSWRNFCFEWMVKWNFVGMSDDSSKNSLTYTMIRRQVGWKKKTTAAGYLLSDSEKS